MFSGPVSLSESLVMAHSFNLSTWEAMAGGSLGLRLAWSSELVPGQTATQRNPVSQKQWIL